MGLLAAYDLCSRDLYIEECRESVDSSVMLIFSGYI